MLLVSFRSPPKKSLHLLVASGACPPGASVRLEESASALGFNGLLVAIGPKMTHWLFTHFNSCLGQAHIFDF